jgi:hypothetical protein
VFILAAILVFILASILFFFNFISFINYYYWKYFNQNINFYLIKPLVIS